jgi:hypothetical protein
MNKVKITIVAVACYLAACVDESNTVRTLQNHGFSNIQTTGWTPFTCSEDDAFSTGFVAINATGQKVSGTVCCGLLKSCTVRF